MHLNSLWNAVDWGHQAEAVWRWGLSMCTTNDVKVFCQPGFSQSLRQSTITARLLEATVWERPVVSTFTPLWGSQNIEGIPGADLWFCFHWRHFFIPWTLMLLGDLNKHCGAMAGDEQRLTAELHCCSSQNANTDAASASFSSWQQLEWFYVKQGKKQ